MFNARGTGESPVATPQFYSASQTDDLRAAVRHLRNAYPGTIGFALLRASPLKSEPDCHVWPNEWIIHKHTPTGECSVDLLFVL